MYRPCGAGKTYISVAFALNALLEHRVKKIILTRPAVEAGEKLGFLPGDMVDKVDPYLKPLTDAIIDLITVEHFNKLTEQNVIEIAPLAYMRGRTLNNAYIIVDEAQNMTKTQMKMCLTRLGFKSKMIINGDLSQTDLPSNIDSGLKEAISLLQNINGICINRLSAVDVCRHDLVQKIISAYEKDM